MATEAATVNIPADVIQPIVQARIQAAIVEALGREAQLIEAAVTAALGQKVDRTGKVSQYSSDNKFSLLEAMANQYIQQAAKDALHAYLQKAGDQIRARVEKELQKKSGVLAAALVDGFSKSVDSTYGFSITVNLKRDSE